MSLAELERDCAIGRYWVDLQIAAIVRSRGARLATRNVRDLADHGIAIVDPWGEA